MRVIAALALALAAAPSIAAAQRFRDRDHGDTAAWLDDCRDQDRRWDDRDRERHCEVRLSSVRATGGTLQIDASMNGSVSVMGGDVNTIQVVAKIQADAESMDEARRMAREIRIEVTPTSISATGPTLGRRMGWAVSFDVTVPRNQSISAETHNGGVFLEGLNGTVEARAVNGPVTVREMSGDVTGRTTNGPITAELSGTSWQGRGLDLQTTNGPVTVRIPENYNAHLETGTVNGPMRIDFPVTVQGRITKRFSVDIGKGGPTVRAVTTNGPVVIRRS